MEPAVRYQYPRARRKQFSPFYVTMLPPGGLCTEVIRIDVLRFVAIYSHWVPSWAGSGSKTCQCFCRQGLRKSSGAGIGGSGGGLGIESCVEGFEGGVGSGFRAAVLGTRREWSAMLEDTVVGGVK
jgi:hypothetical protein